MTTLDAQLNRMAELTRDYGRMLNRSTGLCSLWTGTCLGVLTILTFGWTWQRYLVLGRPKGYYILFMLSTRESLPAWILGLAFLLPFLWAPVVRMLGRLTYPERFGLVQAQPPVWLRGLEPVAGPLNRWFCLGFPTVAALACGFGLPLLGRVIGNPSEMNAFLWRAFLAPLMGLLWFWLVPHLRKAEASEGSSLLYVGCLLLVGRDLSMVLIVFPLYVLTTVAVIAYGIWAHSRYRRAVDGLEALAPEASDV